MIGIEYNQLPFLISLEVTMFTCYPYQPKTVKEIDFYGCLGYEILITPSFILLAKSNTMERNNEDKTCIL